MAEKYYLMPGCSISKDGLPGKKLEVKQSGEPLLIKEVHIKILGKNLPFLVSQKRVMTGTALEELEKEAKKAEESEEARKKAQTEAKIKALIEEAKSLGIEEIPENPTQKALKELIEAKKAENAKAEEAKKAENTSQDGK